MKQFFFGALFFIVTFYSNAQIYISEVMPSNTWTVADPDFGEYSDWIELHNGGSQAVDLRGYQISDKENFSNPYTFRNALILQPDEYIVLWADGYIFEKGTLIHPDWSFNPYPTKAYHLNFKLKLEGEGVYLRSALGEVVDGFSYDASVTDVAIQHEGANVGYYRLPTPGEVNDSIVSNNLVKSEPVTFSQEAGFTSSFNLALSAGEEASIFYTVDGSYPTLKSNLYSGPISVEATATVRAVAIEPNKIASDVETKSYNLVRIGTPYINLTMDNNDLWNASHGLYRHSRKDHEIPASMEMFDESGIKQFKVNAGAELFGTTIFQLEQKPFSIRMKGKYGDDVLEYQLFKDKPGFQYTEFNLRNGGNDYNLTMMRDGFLATLGSRMNHIDYQAYRPVVVLLNGQYWGIYNIREKMNENYLYNNKHVSPDRVDVLEDSLDIKEGSDKAFVDLMEYFDNHPMWQQEHYEYASSKIDIDAFIDYMILKSYIGYISYEVNNKYWRSHDEDLWHWLSFDLEHGYECCGGHDVSQNTIEEYLYGREEEFSLQIFRSLIHNSSFKKSFVNRYNTYLQTVFKPENVIQLIDSLANNIRPELGFHFQRWAGSGSMSSWFNEIERLKYFAQLRPGYIREHLKQVIPELALKNVTIRAEGGGKVLFNDVLLEDSIWVGQAYANDGNQLGVETYGYRFNDWSDGVTLPHRSWNPQEGSAMIARFSENTFAYQGQLTDTTIWDNQEMPYIVSGDLTIPENAILIIKEGVTVEIEEEVSLIVNGELKVEGSAGKEVLIKPKDQLWGAIVLSDAKYASFEYAEISGADIGHNNSFAAITSLNTNLVIDHCKIDGSRQPVFTEGGIVHISNSYFQMEFVGDLINVTQTDSCIVENNEFRGNREQDTDAIDLDGVSNGVVRGNWIYGFRGSNSDGIDLGEECSNILVEDNQVYFCSDKGVSVGQASTVTVKNNVITLCGQGVGVKDDGAVAIVEYNTFDANKIGLASFEKNPGVGGGMILSDHNLITYSDDTSLFVDEKSVITTSNDWFGNTDYVNRQYFNLNLSASDSLIGASYLYDETRHPKVFLNEIHYAATDTCDTGEWVEIMNEQGEALPLENWQLTDGSSFMVANADASIEANDYAVFAKKTEQFEAFHGRGVQGDFDFSLSDEGERLTLFDEKGMPVNSVLYDVAGEWIVNEYKPLAFYIDSTDNTFGKNWGVDISCWGTPFKANDSAVGLGDQKTNKNLAVFPNPTSDQLFLEEDLEYELYNLMGIELMNGRADQLNVSGLVDGVYILRTENGTARFIKQ